MRPRRRGLAALVCALGALGVLAPGAAAQDPAPPPGSGSDAAAPEGGPVGDPPPGEGLSAAVAALPLESAALDRAREELRRVEERRREDLERLEALSTELDGLASETAALRGLVGRRDAQLEKAADAHATAREALRGIAVEWFVTGFGALEGLDPALTAAERDQLSHQYVISEAAALAALADAETLAARVAQLRAERDQLGSQLADREARTARLASERDDRVQSVQDAERRLPSLERRVVVEQMSARVEGTDLSATALDAYWRAQRTLALLSPRCGVPWWVLAGIGKVESRHGTYRGSSLAVDGMVDPPIYGPYLDGSHTAFAIVPDTDRGLLDGTASTDRAVGPMQFLPGTWRIVGTDGDGDGMADPQNLFDAAVSAGVYLCRSGPLDVEPRLRGALLTYNRSNPYVDSVLAIGRSYLDQVPVR